MSTTTTATPKRRASWATTLAIGEDIGRWSDPGLHPLDILATDSNTAVRIGHMMTCGYRDLALAALTKIAEQHKIIQRQRETIGAMREAYRAFRQSIGSTNGKGVQLR